MEKMKKLAKIVDIVVIAALCLLIISVGYVLITDFVVGRLDNCLNDLLKLSDMEIENQAEVLDISAIPALFWWLSATALVLVSAVLVYCFVLVRRILKPLKAGTPFDGTTSRNSFILAVVILVGCIMTEGVMALIRRGIIQCFSGPARYSVTRSGNLGGWLTILFLFLISYIFKYGEELQRQADETL